MNLKELEAILKDIPDKNLEVFILFEDKRKNITRVIQRVDDDCKDGLCKPKFIEFN